MNLSDAQVGVLAEHQYQELELWYPLLRLREAGANVLVVGPTDTQVYGSKLGYPVTADVAAEAVSADDFDALVIPGGFAPEGLRRSSAIIDLVRKVHARGGLIAAICHAGWVLASAGIARGRKLTCVSLIKDDVMNAGGIYVDEPVVRDGNVITSRLPSDLPQFGQAIVDYLATHPSTRQSPRRLSPSRDRRPASAEYQAAAHVVMAARGKASANYILTVVDGGAKP